MVNKIFLNIFGGDPYDVDSIINNENFDVNKMKNDISLLKISGSIKFNTHVQPIKLPTSNIGEGETCIVTGWSYTEVCNFLSQ